MSYSGKVPREKFEDLFMFSWKSWLGDEKYKIKLLVSKEWADRIRPRMLIKGTESNKAGLTAPYI